MANLQTRLSGSALGAERAMWDATLERGMVELRHKQILARVDVLNSINTQAMLVAGAAVQSIGGESLESLDASENIWHRLLSYLFVGTTAFTLACALWVIVTASNIIMLSQQAVLQGSSAADVATTDAILTRKVADIRLFYLAAIGGLLVSSLFMVWINMSITNTAITMIIFYAFVKFMISTIVRTYEEFEAKTSLRPNARERANPLHRIIALISRELPDTLLDLLRQIPCWHDRGEDPDDDDTSAALSTAYSRGATPFTRGSTYAKLVEEEEGSWRAQEPPPPPPQQSTTAAAAATSSTPPPPQSSSAAATAPKSRERASSSTSSTAQPQSPRSKVSAANAAAKQARLQGWLRKAPSWRQDPRHPTLAVSASAGRLAAIESLPTLSITPNQHRFFVIRMDGTLAYYRAEEEVELDLEPRATLSLHKHEVRTARDAKGQLLLVLVERKAGTSASSSTAEATSAASPRGSISGGLAALFGAGDPRVWAIQGKDTQETRLWIAEVEKICQDTNRELQEEYPPAAVDDPPPTPPPSPPSPSSPTPAEQRRTTFVVTSDVLASPEAVLASLTEDERRSVTAIQPVVKRHAPSCTKEAEAVRMVQAAALRHLVLPKEADEGWANESKRQYILAPATAAFAPTTEAAALETAGEEDLSPDGCVHFGLLFSEAPPPAPHVLDAASTALDCLYDLAPLRPGLRLVRDGIGQPSECALAVSAIEMALSTVELTRLGARSSAALTADLIESVGREKYNLLYDLRERCKRAVSVAFGEETLYHAGALITRIDHSAVTAAEAEEGGVVPYWHAHVDKCSILSYDISAVLYLNGCEGGAFAFLDPDGADRLVEPKAGRLLAFTSGVENVHQVRRVTSGARYAIAMWFTLSAEHRQPEAELRQA